MPISFSAVEDLNLEGLELVNENVQYLVKLLDHSKSLRRLNIAYNRINSNGLENLL